MNLKQYTEYIAELDRISNMNQSMGLGTQASQAIAVLLEKLVQDMYKLSEMVLEGKK